MADMTCLCGYRYAEVPQEMETGTHIVRPYGQTPFVKIEVIAQSMSSWAGMKDVALYICPNCGTVHAEQWR